MSDAETKIINFRPPRRILAASWRRTGTLIALGVSLLLVAVVALNWQLVPGNTPVVTGTSAPETIRAPRRVTFISQSRTRVLRDQAAAQVAQISDYDSNILRQLR